MKDSNPITFRVRIDWVEFIIQSPQHRDDKRYPINSNRECRINLGWDPSNEAGVLKLVLECYDRIEDAMICVYIPHAYGRNVLLILEKYAELRLGLLSVCHHHVS